LNAYLEPLPRLPEAGEDPADLLPLAGGPLVFDRVVPARRDGAAARREPPRALSRVEAGGRAFLHELSRPRPGIAGLDWSRPRIMAILNVTPDSFSDGGDRFDEEQAIAAGLTLAREGADIVDVGGESTRPRSDPVSEAEELRRVLPVVQALVAAGVRVSIDTRRAAVIEAAAAAGAVLINDVTALRFEPRSLAAAAATGLPVVLMHMQGEPKTMQEAPHYDDVVLDVFDFLQTRVEACEAAGIPRARVLVDPGIGFGKTVRHNLELLRRLALLHGLGCPLLVGLSRKGFIGRLSAGEPPKERLAGTLAGCLAAVARGAQMLRVHDVRELKQALAVWTAIA